jgi:hypothetical protein
MTLTPEQLRSMLSYDPETGEFIWMVKPNGRVNAGVIAGSILNNRGYRLIGIHGRRLLAHRLAWLYTFGRWPSSEIDHINGNRRDNRISNLREASKSENQSNRGPNKNNTSGFKGVKFHKKTSKWQAQITKDRKRYNLGLFHTPEAAHVAYESAAKKFYGEFARAK